MLSSLKDFISSQLPTGFTIEDVMEPDNPAKNKSYNYLQELSKQLEAAKTQMMGGFGSVADSKYVRDKWSLAYKEFNVTKFQSVILLTIPMIVTGEQTERRANRSTRLYERT